jgi:hypothetical protein
MIMEEEAEEVVVEEVLQVPQDRQAEDREE